MYSSGAGDSIKLLKLSAERVDFGRGCNRACCTPGQPRCNTIAAGCSTSCLIEQCSSGPFVRSMSTCVHEFGIQVGDVHRVVTVVHGCDAGREDGVAVNDALRREPWTWSMVVTEHTPPAGLTACIIRKYIERVDGEGRDRSQKCGSETSRSKDAGVVQG